MATVQFGRVLVYGAAGVQGGAVARHLLRSGIATRVLARRPEQVAALGEAGAEVATGDLDDAESLRAAHRGVDAVALVLPQVYDPELIHQYGRNAVDAAREAGARVVFNTSTPVPDAATDLLAAESRRAVRDYLREREVPHVTLMPPTYMENVAAPWTAPAIVHEGVFAYPMPEAVRSAWIGADDMAALTAAALARPDLAGRTFAAGGPEALMGDEIAARFAAALDRPVRYVRIPPDDFERGLTGVFGAVAAREIANIYRWLDAHPAGWDTGDPTETARELSVRLTPFAEWIGRHDWEAMTRQG